MTKLKTDLVKIWTLQRSRIYGIYGTILIIDVLALFLGANMYIPLTWNILFAYIVWSTFVFWNNAYHLKKGVTVLSNFLFCISHLIFSTLYIKITDLLFYFISNLF